MASLMNTALPWLNAGGTALSTIGQVGGGIMAQRSADSAARQYRQNANAARVTSQYQAAEERRQARYATSRGAAVAAASGGGVSDPTVVNTLADIEAEGEYRALMALYNGEQEARGLERAAQAKSREGTAALFAGVAGGGSTLLSGGVDWYEKYGGAQRTDGLSPVTVSSQKMLPSFRMTRLPGVTG